MWNSVVNFMHELFPGEQLEVLLEMLGLFVVMVIGIRLRAELWDRWGLGSIVFLTEQKFQTLFGDEHEREGRSGMDVKNGDSATERKAPR